MSLSRSMAYRIAALTAGLVFLALMPLYALLQLRLATRHAYDEYKELRMVDTTAVHLAAVQGLIEGGEVDMETVQGELDQALDGINVFLDFQKKQPRDVPAHEDAEYRTAQQAAQTIQSVRTHVASLTGESDAVTQQAKLVRDLAAAHQALRDLSGHMSTEITRNYEALLKQLEVALGLTGTLGLAIVVITIALNRSLYRSVIRPLNRLRHGVRNITSGNFTERLELSGHGEFSEVAEDFNRMTAELDAMYRDLEQKVRTKSRELVRSERLASVGFLAAGVAHEINNPLNIISGYAELSLRRLEQTEDEAGGRAAGLLKSLEIIRDESFRCKQIIEKLLSLSRSGSDDRLPVDISRTVEEVVGMVQTLKAYRDRRIRLDGTEPGEALSRATDAEVKQVLLNLVLNALEATEPGRGCIDVTVKREMAVIRVSVRDNGRGMPPEVLEHIFEPFFTDRRGISPPGTGLGLTIAHAIVESHGGRIWAESEGAGRGSQFVIELPRCG